MGEKEEALWEKEMYSRKEETQQQSGEMGYKARKVGKLLCKREKYSVKGRNTV